MQSCNEYQREIIANVSHDFRSPLTSIKGYAEAIKDGTIPPEQQDKYLDVVLFEVERLTKLTSNLLILNTMDQQGMILQPSEFDINEVIKNLARTFEMQWGLWFSMRESQFMYFPNPIYLIGIFSSNSHKYLINQRCPESLIWEICSWFCFVF